MKKQKIISWGASAAAIAATTTLERAQAQRRRQLQTRRVGGADLKLGEPKVAELHLALFVFGVFVF